MNKKKTRQTVKSILYTTLARPIHKRGTHKENFENRYVDFIDLEEVAKNRKATGMDVMNTELIKYGGALLELRFLHFPKMCWMKFHVPKEWNGAKVISLFKKGE